MEFRGSDVIKLHLDIPSIIICFLITIQGPLLELESDLNALMEKFDVRFDAIMTPLTPISVFITLVLVNMST